MIVRNSNKLVWLWLFALLTSTVGVSVHKIYCYCLNETTYSLLSISESCSAENQSFTSDGCCKKQSKSCCEKPTSKQPCTKKTTQFFQLKTEFTVEKPFEKTLDFPVFEVGQPVFFEKFYTSQTRSASRFNKAPPPPPRPGKQIRLQIQSLRC